MIRITCWAIVSLVTITAASAGVAAARTIHVDSQHPAASDENPGTASEPLGSIAGGVEAARPGDTVLVHAGTYRESVALKTSGTPEKPIRLVAPAGERTIVSGLEPVAGPWSVHEGSILKTTVDGPVRQLFVDGRMMTEARWPNSAPDRLWDRSSWAHAGEGSRYGKMVDPNLAAADRDFTGAVAVLNVAHQFYSWTRPVLNHAAGSDTFEYAKDLSGITSFADKTKPWEDDRYYLFGTLAALDVPGEWHYDAETGTLYFWPPEGCDPAQQTVERKARDDGFSGSKLAHVEIRGFHFFGCAFSLLDADHVVVEGCHFRYPVMARRLAEPGFKEDGVGCRITGTDNAVRNSSFAFGSTFGLKVQGAGNLVENNLFHDFCWNGSLKFPGLSLSGTKPPSESDRNIARYNTLCRFGNAVLSYRGPGQTIEQNHVYDGGLCCKDVALVYTGSPSTAGNIVRYNWVHGCHTEGHMAGGLHGGLGIRGDDQTRSLTVHHNVVWDCGRDGIIVKGDDNRVAHNTVFDIGTPDVPGNYVNLHVAKEPEKWWRDQFPLLPVQNENSLIANNAAWKITGDNRGEPYPFEKNLVANYQGRDLKLLDPAAFDFRPADDSPLVDAGKPVEGLTGRFEGAAPDVGAYEHGLPRWVPGHRNALWLRAERDAGNDRAWTVSAMLSMPVFEPLAVSIAGASSGIEVSQASLEFGPEDWMEPQQLGVSSGPNAAQVQVAIDRLGLDKTVDLQELLRSGPVRLSFPAVP